MNPRRPHLARFLAALFFAVVLSGTSGLADGMESAFAPLKPWNGYWWPIKDNGMISGTAVQMYVPLPIYYPDWRGHFAPFDKYNAAFGENPRGELWRWEHLYHDDPEALGWAGHCNGWAAAAIFEPEPAAGEQNGVYFRVGDKKALLTEMHQGDVGTTYGLDPGNPSATIAPQLFHATLIQYLRDLGKPIVVEKDPSEEIWNFPCYGYEMSWSDIGSYREYTTTCYFSSDFVSPDTTDASYFTETYTYRFLIEGGELKDCEWTGDSVTDHPDFMWDVAGRSSSNPYLDSERVSQLMATTISPMIGDDSLEDNDTLETAARLQWDVFFGRLLDPDYFWIPTEAGETVDVAFHPEKLDVAPSAVLTDATGNSVGTQEEVDSHIVLHAGMQAEDQLLYLGINSSISQANHRNYEIDIDRMGKAFFMPHVVNADGWSTEMCLYNPGTSTDNLFFHFYRTAGGTVEKRYYHSTVPTLAEGALTIGPLDSFFTDLDPDNERWMKIRTDGDLEGVFLFSNNNYGGNLASMPLEDQGAYLLYFNHLAVDDTWWTGVSIANTDPYHTAHVLLQPFAPDGTALGMPLSLPISGGGRYINMLSQAFPSEILAATGWIRVTSDVPVVGFELFGTNDLALFEGIPLQSESDTTLVAPWAAPGAGWWTGISIVNTSHTVTTVRIEPRNASGLNAYGTTNPRYEQLTLSANSKWVVLVDQLFPSPTNGPITYLRIETMNPSQPVTGFILYGNFAQEVLCGYTLKSAADLRNAGVLAWKEGSSLIVNNALGSNRATVSLTACDAAGNSLATVQTSSVGIKTVAQFDIAGLFGGAMPEGTVFLRWTTGGRNVLILQEVLQSGRGTVLPSLD